MIYMITITCIFVYYSYFLHDSILIKDCTITTIAFIKPNYHP